jgi:hypothetical protein
MPIFKDDIQFYNVFGALMEEVILGPKVKRKLEKTKLTLKFITSDPDTRVWINHDQVVTGDEADKDAAITLSFPADLAHKFYLKQLSVGEVLKFKEVKMKGMLPKLMSLLPLLTLVFDKYPEQCQKHGIPVD